MKIWMRWESSFVCVFCFVWGGGRGRSFGNCLILSCKFYEVEDVHGFWCHFRQIDSWWQKGYYFVFRNKSERKEKGGISWLLFTRCSIFRRELSLFWQLKSLILMRALRYYCNTVNAKWELSFCFQNFFSVELSRVHCFQCTLCCRWII